MTRPVDRSTASRCKCGSPVYMQRFATITLPVNPDGRVHECPKPRRVRA